MRDEGDEEGRRAKEKKKLTGELRDEGDERPAKWREKKNLRKKEERGEAGERERERERERENELNILMRESVIKKYFFLALSYSAHLKIDVHCS